MNHIFLILIVNVTLNGKEKPKKRIGIHLSSAPAVSVIQTDLNYSYHDALGAGISFQFNSSDYLGFRFIGIYYYISFTVKSENLGKYNQKINGFFTSIDIDFSQYLNYGRVYGGLGPAYLIFNTKRDTVKGPATNILGLIAYVGLEALIYPAKNFFLFAEASAVSPAYIFEEKKEIQFKFTKIGAYIPLFTGGIRIIF